MKKPFAAELRKYTKGDFDTEKIVWNMVQKYGEKVKMNTPFRLSYLAQEIQKSGITDKNELFKCDVLIVMSSFYCPFMRIQRNKMVQI